MSIVSDSSPLISLARISQLDLLRHLYGEIIVPEAVWQEVVVDGAGQPGAETIRQAPWVRCIAVNNRTVAEALRQGLDAGEAEAIALAIEGSAELLLIDDRLGRESAQHLGVHCVGLVGVLVEAKQKKVIALLRPHLDALRYTAGFHISEALYHRVLADWGE